MYNVHNFLIAVIQCMGRNAFLYNCAVEKQNTFKIVLTIVYEHGLLNVFVDILYCCITIAENLQNMKPVQNAQVHIL